MKKHPRLSARATRIINEIRRTGRSDSKDYEVLFSEFDHFINDLSSSIYGNLNGKSSLNWVVTDSSIKDEDDNKVLKYNLLLKHTDEVLVDLEINFNPRGESFVSGEIDPLLDRHDKWPKAWISFLQSAPYKRYFRDYSEGLNASVNRLKSVLPQRQLTSRYLFDYMVHLIEQMNVCVNVLLDEQKNKKRSVCPATIS